MILLDRRFGLAAVETEHPFNERAQLGLELAANLRATVGNLYSIIESSVRQPVQHLRVWRAGASAQG